MPRDCHADKPVFHEIEPADAMPLAEIVEHLSKVAGDCFFSVNRDRNRPSRNRR